MRLSISQAEIIRHTIDKNLGSDLSIWLFGSRADDSKRGGDVDIYVEPENEKSLLKILTCKIALEEELDLHVDLLVKSPGKDKPIYQLAKAHGIKL